MWDLIEKNLPSLQGFLHGRNADAFACKSNTTAIGFLWSIVGVLVLLKLALRWPISDSFSFKVMKNGG